MIELMGYKFIELSISLRRDFFFFFCKLSYRNFYFILDEHLDVIVDLCGEKMKK